MNTLINKIGAVRVTPTRFFGFWIVLAAILFSLVSCSDDLDVQQSYPFAVEVMPYGDKITKGETVELRFEIKPQGNYSNTMYTIRYFQYDGECTLKLVDGPVLVNNDRVLLESKTFRLNYTAKSSDAHKFLVVIEDNFGTIVGPINPGLLLLNRNAYEKDTVNPLGDSDRVGHFAGFRREKKYHGAAAL